MLKFNGMKKLASILAFAVLAVVLWSCGQGQNKATETAAVKPDSNNAGLRLQPGFSAFKVAENTGSPRHFVVTPQGDIYVKLSAPVCGKGILRLPPTGAESFT